MAEKRLIDVEECPCDGCKVKPCGHPAKCVKFAGWLNKTVDAVQVAHGRWIDKIDTDTQMHECSVCGARVVKGLYEYDNPNRYCYHCGAKMDGERRTDGKG